MGLSPPGETYNEVGIGTPLLNGPTEFGDASPLVTLYTTEPHRLSVAGDILFCVRGSTTGRMNWSDREYAIGRGVAAIRARDGADTRYLRACIDFQLPSLLQRAGGSTFPNLSFRDLATFEVPLPPLRTQRKIAAILSAYDDLIGNNNRRIKLLEEVAQRIYREWFVDFRYPGHEVVPLVDSNLGRIPQGWSVCHLEDAANVMRGLSWERDQEVASGGLPIITIPNIQERLHLDGMTRLEGINDSNVRKFSLAYGDTVLVGSNGNPERVGQAVSVPRGAEVLFASFLMRVRPDQSLIGAALLHMQLKDPRLTRTWRASAVGSTSLRNIRLSTLRASPVLLPEAGVHARGEEQLRQILDLQDATEKQSVSLHTTRDLLLPHLISGEIDVTDLNIAAPDIAA